MQGIPFSKGEDDLPAGFLPLNQLKTYELQPWLWDGANSKTATRPCPMLNPRRLLYKTSIIEIHNLQPSYTFVS